MRYIFGLLCVCALGVVPLVGCSEAEPECRVAADCDDQNECTDDGCKNGICYFETPAEQTRVCDDGDGNECVYGKCVDDVCTTVPADIGVWVDNGTPCESDGVSGVCLCGLCKDEPECWTDEECDDGNECSDDFCDYCTGSCEADTWFLECRPCDRSGIQGVCFDGVCEEKTECSADEQCDDGIACTNDFCDDCYGCLNLSNCSDGDPCTEDECDRDTDECYYPVSPDGTYCGCLGWGPDPDWICRIYFCPPVCTHYGYCQDGVCV